MLVLWVIAIGVLALAVTTAVVAWAICHAAGSSDGMSEADCAEQCAPISTVEVLQNHGYGRR